MTDKELVRRSRVRFERLQKEGVKNDAMGMLKNALNIFYSDKKSKKTAKSGISINKRMTTQERATMRKILRSFMRDKTSTPSGIKSEYNKLIGKYEETTQHGKEPTIKNMSQKVEFIKRNLTDRMMMKILPSNQVSRLWEHQKDSGKSTDEYRNGFLNFIKNTAQDKEIELDYNDIRMGKMEGLETIFEDISTDEMVDSIIELAVKG